MRARWHPGFGLGQPAATMGYESEDGDRAFVGIGDSFEAQSRTCAIMPAEGLNRDSCEEGGDGSSCPLMRAVNLRNSLIISWKKDRGKNPPGAPWGIERENDRHLTCAQKLKAGDEAHRTVT